MRLAHQTALAEFARRALNASAVEPLRAEATMLAHQVFPEPTSGAFELVLDADEEEVTFAAAVADIFRAATPPMPPCTGSSTNLRRATGKARRRLASQGR